MEKTDHWNILKEKKMNRSMYARGGHGRYLVTYRWQVYKAQPSSVSSRLWVEARFFSWLLAVSCQISYFSFLRRKPIKV